MYRTERCLLEFDAMLVKVKVKFTLEEATNAQRECRGEAVFFL